MIAGRGRGGVAIESQRVQEKKQQQIKMETAHDDQLQADQLDQGQKCLDIHELSMNSFFQVFCIVLFVAHLLHQALGRFDQPSAVSQMLAGILLGRTGNLYKKMLGIEEEYSINMVRTGRLLFMFLLGIELDLTYLWRTRHRSAIVAFTGAATCILLAFATHWFTYNQTNAKGSKPLYVAIVILHFTNTASPLLLRMVTELKLTSSEIGRLAISAGLLSDITCLTLVAFVATMPIGMEIHSLGRTFMERFLALLLTAAVCSLIHPIARLMNRRNRLRRHITNHELVFLLAFLFWVSLVAEAVGYNTMMASFMMGVILPRDGATARTIIDKLTYLVHVVILPAYFGAAGMQTDLGLLVKPRNLAAVITMLLLSTVGKVSGTVLATKYILNIPFKEGLALGLLLNVKGHVDVIILNMAMKYRVWDEEGYSIMMITTLLSTLIAGPAASNIVRRERKAFQHRSMGIEWLKPDSELRVLACVHKPRQAPTMLALMELARGPPTSSYVTYLMHLTELTQRYTITSLYHRQSQKTSFDHGADDIRQVNMAVDAFTKQAHITVRQITAVSQIDSMHKDVCNGAQDTQSALVLVPFHRQPRFDGKMFSSNDELRQVNLRVLRHAPCTVGIVVDRGLVVVGPSTSSSEATYHVAALFFGGPDDREAVAYACRLAVHACVAVTIVRFMNTSQRSSHESAYPQQDNDYMSEFYNKFVVPGTVTYMEKVVANGPETVAAMRPMVGKYSLFIVGKGRNGSSPMTLGLGDWQANPELGQIGNLLASSDFMTTGSVLILQQHNVSGNRHED